MSRSLFQASCENSYFQLEHGSWLLDDLHWLILTTELFLQDMHLCNSFTIIIIIIIIKERFNAAFSK